MLHVLSWLLFSYLYYTLKKCGYQENEVLPETEMWTRSLFQFGAGSKALIQEAGSWADNSSAGTA
jgi:hypothetical protein